MNNITIKDVAKKASVSTATVSRVVNGFSNVKPETAKLVMDAIEELNFYPNNVAKNLKVNQTKAIGLIISNISNSHFAQMSKTIDRVLHAQNFGLVVCNTDDDPALEREYINRLIGLRVDGIILNTSGLNDGFVSGISKQIPVVLVDRNITDPDFEGDFVGSNGFAGVQSLTRHLIELGHRDIGIITSNLNTSTGRERLDGFKATMKEIGINIDEDYPYRFDAGNFNIDGGIEGCRYLMNLEKKPTAIVVANNDMAIGCYKYLRANNYRVPEDVSVVSYGNISNSDLFPKEPTCTTLNPSFLGEKAASLLLSRIVNKPKGNREVIFEPVLMVNATTKAI